MGIGAKLRVAGDVIDDVIFDDVIDNLAART